MKLIVFSILLCISTSSWVRGQQYHVIPQPRNRVLIVDGVWQENQDDNSKRWDVVSDRNENQVYQDKDCTIPQSSFKLNFGDTFYVLDYNSGRSLLITKPDKVLANGNFIGSNSDIGWVKEETMVLSRKTIRTVSNRLMPGIRGFYTKKAFVINVLGSYSPPTFYTDPRMSSADILTSKNVNTAFYIYKESANSVLLGTNPEKQSVIDENLSGWVDRRLIVEWNHNTGMEQNWETTAVNQRRSSTPKTPSRIFSTPEDAIAYSHNQRGSNNPPLYDEENKGNTSFQSVRMPKDFFRSPVIETIVQDSLYQVGSIERALGNIDSIRYKGRFIDKRDVIDTLRHIIDQFNTFNFIFMIDGTHSILPYKQTIIDNISSSLGSLQQMAVGSQKILKYYSIIYRDDAYSHPFSIMNGLTQNSNDLLDFIKQNLSKDLLTFKPGITTDDQPEAMNWGFNIIDKELSSIGEFEKTFVIVLGDAGNHTNQIPGSRFFIDQNSVVELLKKKNYCVSAIQINHKTSDPTYNQFQSQFKDILTKYYREDKNITIPQMAQVVSGTSIFRWPNINVKRVPSVLIYPPNGQSLSNDILGNQIRNLILNAPYAELNAKLPFEVPQAFIDILNIPTNDPQYDDKILYGLMNYYYFKGDLTQFVKNGNTLKLFNDVQFFSVKELTEINSLLSILIPDNYSTSSSSARQRLLDAWVEILVNRLKVVDQSKVGNVTLREASLFLTQNKGQSGWDKIRINDINNENIFPDSLLGEYYYDWFTAKLAVFAINNNTSITKAIIKQHSDVFEFCFELLHPEIYKDQTEDQRIRSINQFVDKSFSLHFSHLQYDDKDYVSKIIRCLCEYPTFIVKNGQIVNGFILKAFWVSGDCFPHENNYAPLIFN